MIDFLILYEHKARELDSICLLKAALQQKGYSVVIEKTGYLNYAKYRKKANRPKVILTYSMYDDSSVAVQVLTVGSSKVKKVVNLHWEEIIDDNETAIKAHTPQQNAAKATHICWGEGAFQRLKNAGVENAVITGAMHIDFLRKEFAPMYLTREEICKNYHIPEGKMLLYISSFNTYDLTEKEISILEEKLGNSFVQFLKEADETKTTTIEWFKQLLADDHHLSIVYRPHPGENKDERLSELEKNNRFFVISDGTARQWILASDIITTWVSTAITEVYFANKKCLIIRPYPISHDVPLFDQCKSINNYDDLLAEINNEDSPFPVDESKFKYHYANNGNRFAFQNVVDLLEKVYSSDSFDIPNYSLSVRLLALRFRFKLFVKRMVVRFHISKKTFPFSLSKKFKEWIDLFYLTLEKEKSEEATEEEINERVKLFTKIITGPINDK